MLFPTRMVLINLDGVLIYFAQTIAHFTPCPLFNSIRNLFADKKAISSPEKKADKRRVKRITKKEDSIVLAQYKSMEIIEF